MDHEPTSELGSNHRDALILLLIVALAAFLRFYRLEDQSLWYDEAYTASVTDPAAGGLSYIWSSGPVAYMPPLHHTLVYVSRLLGPGEAPLRLPSVLAGILTVAFVYLTAKYCFDRRTATFASLLAAVSAFHVYYSQEARAYALLMLLSVASTYYLLRALREKRRFWWIAYMVSAALGLYTHLFMAFVVLAQNAYLLLEWDRKRVSGRAWVLSQLVPILLFSPWLVAYAIYYKEMFLGASGVLERTAREVWVPPPLWNLPFATLGIFFHGTSFELESIAKAANLGPAWVTAATWLQEGVYRLVAPYLVFAAIALWRMRDRSDLRRYGILVGVMLLLPLLAMYAISFQTRILNPRYFSFAYPYFCIALATGIATLQNPRARMVLLAVVIAVNALSLANYYYNPLHQRDPWREVASLLRENALPADAVFVCCSEAQIALNYYYSASPAPSGLNVPFQGTPNESWSYLQTIMGGRSRAWLVVQANRNLTAVYSDALRRHCQSIALPEVRRIDVNLYASCGP